MSDTKAGTELTGQMEVPDKLKPPNQQTTRELMYKWSKNAQIIWSNADPKVPSKDLDKELVVFGFWLAGMLWKMQASASTVAAGV